MFSRNQALRELNNKPKQYFLTYYQFIPLCCRWGKKRKEEKESKKTWKANIPWLTCTPHIWIMDNTSSAARWPQLWSSGIKNKRRTWRSQGNWDCVRKVPLHHSISYHSTFLQWEPTTFYSRRANLFHCMCVHTYSAVRTWKCFPQSALGFHTHPDPGNGKQCNPSTKNDTNCGTVVLDSWKITDFKLSTT